MAVKEFRWRYRGDWARGIFKPFDITRRAGNNYFIARNPRTAGNNTAPENDAANWSPVHSSGPVAQGIGSFDDVDQMTWTDLKDTIEAWAREWVQGYDTFAPIASASARDGQLYRSKIWLLIYMVWVARHQNGNDRSVELDIPPQLMDESYNMDQLLIRLSSVPLTPANG